MACFAWKLHGIQATGKGSVQTIFPFSVHIMNIVIEKPTEGGKQTRGWLQLDCYHIYIYMAGW